LLHLPPASALSAYSKIRVRGAIDHPLAGVAVSLGARSGTVDTLRIALTALFDEQRRLTPGVGTSS